MPGVQSGQPIPDCLDDHNAPESVCLIFAQLVKLADESDNGQIEINRTGFTNPNTSKPYSQRTVCKAIQWLMAHRLLVRTAIGNGRGHHSRYFVRWSFEHESISERQKAVNHERKKVVTSLPNRRRPVFRILAI